MIATWCRNFIHNFMKHIFYSYPFFCRNKRNAFCFNSNYIFYFFFYFIISCDCLVFLSDVIIFVNRQNCLQSGFRYAKAERVVSTRMRWRLPGEGRAWLMDAKQITLASEP